MYHLQSQLQQESLSSTKSRYGSLKEEVNAIAWQCAARFTADSSVGQKCRDMLVDAGFLACASAALQTGVLNGSKVVRTQCLVAIAPFFCNRSIYGEILQILGLPPAVLNSFPGINILTGDNAEALSKLSEDAKYLVRNASN